MSSSGLIYAVIVGAWAAYLVPMWLRRQDELNEARPTERFSTAIRLLSGRAGMERRYAKELQQREGRDALGPGGGPGDDAPDSDAPAERRGAAAGIDAASEDFVASGEVAEEPVEVLDVRAFADPVTMIQSVPSVQAPVEPAGPPEADVPPSGEGRERRADVPAGSVPAQAQAPAEPVPQPRRLAAVDRVQRAKLLARRRRTTVVLFLGFTAGTIVAAVGGLAFLWAPAAPAALLSAYIAHLRRQERRRFAVAMDRRRAEAAARQLRERRARADRDPVEPVDSGEPGSRVPEAAGAVRTSQAAGGAAGGNVSARGADGAGSAVAERGGLDRGGPLAGERQARVERQTRAERQALVEETDHAEWVDQERERDRGQPDRDGWEPTPVPLPTYVSAPVAPRTTRGVDLGAADAWSSARSSSTAHTGGPGGLPPADGTDDGPGQGDGSRRPGGTGRPPGSGGGGRTPGGDRSSGSSGSGRAPRAGSEGAPAQRRPRGRGRTPLFDQYADEDRPRAANE